MDWVLRNPEIHSTFGSLGFAHPDGYHINKNCNAALETILHNILTEDKYLRTYRRSISFGQNINKDLIPLLINAKEDKTIELLISILVNLTIPIECLLAVDLISKTDFGRHTVFEINNLLASAKAAFTDQRATKVLTVFLKKNLDNDQKPKLSSQQCTNIGNNLLLLRNILHIPERSVALSPNNGPCHVVQNQILFNIFSQNIDKILIKLMSVPEAANWGVTMVQLIALLYKDQHVVMLHKLLNLWLETALSESSEDNESNTSPPDRGSDNSSPMFTSDPTSDSSDTAGSRKSNDDPNSSNNGWEGASASNSNESEIQSMPPPPKVKELTAVAKTSDVVKNTNEETKKSDNNKEEPANVKSENTSNNKNEKKTIISETSDCGYGTQIENQESISTSSNEDEGPAKKPVHQKPHNPKQRANTKVRAGISTQERKRKKIVKRAKISIINLQGLMHKTPTNDDISNILKEFTVDFLLKGYNSLIQTLHCQILTNVKLEIDTSHFFWLVTYFLKFATQIELDLKHVSSVLSYDIISYLTAEGVNLCEQFELAIKLDGNNLKPCIRRLHLVVTAIREFVQAIEVYKKFTHVDSEDQETLVMLQVKMCETEELRSLLVLLLRYYNPKYHSKQYLQDLVVTNHILLIFLDSVTNFPEYKGSSYMTDHIKQFATTEIMYQFGLLLEDYLSNGEFVNDCVFTMMHHVGGDIDSLMTLFQPKILKTFTLIWKTEFEICEDWSDLVEFVINTFIKKPHSLQSPINIWLGNGSIDEDKVNPKPLDTTLIETKMETNYMEDEKKMINTNKSDSNSCKERWTEGELSSLNWNFMQCSASTDVIGEIKKIFKEDGIIKSRDSIKRELYKQNLINKGEFESGLKSETGKDYKKVQAAKETRDTEIVKLCDQLKQDGKGKFLHWVQKVLLETCFVRICLAKKTADCQSPSHGHDHKTLNNDFFQTTSHKVMSPVSYHSLIFNQSVPLVPWNCEQGSICKDLKFLQLLHKLGFHMPVDTGKVFIRIPHFWTADFLYEVAGKVAPIDTSKLKFSLSDISESSHGSSIHQDLSKDVTMIPVPENLFQIHKQNSFATMVNFTPMPGSSFNSEGSDNENNRQNWLELVQKSQECNLKLNLNRTTITEVDEDNEADIVMISLKEEVFIAPLMGSMSHCGVGPSPLIMPTIMSTDQDSLSHTANIPELEYFKNLCETASVASDLTRMYVSDEEDKSDIIPLGPTEDSILVDEHGFADPDSIAIEECAQEE